MKNKTIAKRLLPIALCCALIFLTACTHGHSTDDTTVSNNLLTENSETTKFAVETYYQTVKYPSKRIISPILHDGKLIMAVTTEERTETDCRYLVSYDLEKGTTDTLFESTHDLANIQQIQANDNWLVWNDLELYASESNIYAMSFETGIITKVNSFAPEAPSYTMPKLMGDCVYWVEEEGLKDEKIYGTVYSYNCKTGKKEAISEMNDIYLYNLSLSADDGKVVWNEQRNGNWYIFVYDTETQKIKSFKTGEKCCYRVDYHDGYVLFVETEDFYRGDASETAKTLEISTGEIKEAKVMTNSPEMFGDYAVASSGSAVWFYRRSGSFFEMMGNLYDKCSFYTISEDEIVITVMKNVGEDSELVNETELHIFDMKEIDELI